MEPIYQVLVELKQGWEIHLQAGQELAIEVYIGMLNLGYKVVLVEFRLDGGVEVI